MVVHSWKKRTSYSKKINYINQLIHIVELEKHKNDDE